MAKGRTQSDIGIYATWTEAQQKTSGVSGADHKKCIGIEEAITYMRAANISDQVIATQTAKVMKMTPDNSEQRQTRAKRHREVKDYRTMSGHTRRETQGNPIRDPINDNTRAKEANKIKTLEQTIKTLQDDRESQMKQKDTEIRKLTEEIKRERTARDQDTSTITTLKSTIATLKKDIDNMTTKHNTTTDELTQRNNILENLIEKLNKTQEKHQEKHQSPLKVSFIADSNRTKITNHLKTRLQDNIIEETNTIYTTSELVNHLNPTNPQSRPPKTDYTIIMMGTNDVRKGKGDEAEANLKLLADHLDQDRTIVSEIPPIEVGRKGGEEYEETVNQRRNLNRTIRAAFKHTVRLTDVNIKQFEEGTILDDRGFHVTSLGGEIIADLIATTAKEVIRKRHREHKQKPQEKTQLDTQATPPHIPKRPSQENAQTSETTTHEKPNETNDNITQTITIPPGIGRHVVGKKGKMVTEIKTRNNVEIHTGAPNHKDETLMAITGRERHIKRAIHEITDIINEHLNRQKDQRVMKAQKGDTVCIHYMKGNCRFGDNCWQLHPTPTQRDRGRSSDKHRDHHSRDRSQNQPRHTSRDRPQNRDRPQHARERSPSRDTPHNQSRHTSRDRPQNRDRPQHARERSPSRDTPHNQSRHTSRDRPQNRDRPQHSRERSPSRETSPHRPDRKKARTEKTIMTNISDLVGKYLHGHRK